MMFSGQHFGILAMFFFQFCNFLWRVCVIFLLRDCMIFFGEVPQFSHSLTRLPDIFVERLPDFFVEVA